MEFPGYVKNMDRTIQMMGGVHFLYQQFSSQTPKLTVSFRPGDPLCHPIGSEQAICPCIAMKIRVVKKYMIVNGKKELINVEYAPQLVGKATVSNFFKQPSDFQFLPALDSPLNEPTVVSESPVQQSFLYLPPPVFLHSYKYDARYIQKRIFASQQSENAKLWKRSAEWVVNQNDLIALECGPRPPERANDVTDEMLEIFREMFERRPIWTSLAVYDHLVSVNEQRSNILDIAEASPAIFHALACVAYHVKTGPFKSCWVRYGINPLLKSDYKLYQVVVVSLREWEHADELMKRVTRKRNKYIAKKIGSIPVGVSKAETLPDRLYFGIQIIDIITHPVLEELLSRSNNEYSFNTGWFSFEQIKSVRDFLVLKYTRMMEMENGESLGNVIMSNIASVQDVTKELGEKTAQRQSGEQFDFEFVNVAQDILGIYDSHGDEGIDELLGAVSQKTCSLVLDRIFSY